MEVPAPESGKATATGKRGTGVGRAPESRAGGGCGTRRRGDAEPGSTPAGGRARALPWGRGAEGAGRKGEGLPAVPRPSALPVLAPWPRCSSVVGLLLLPSPRPPIKIKPETCRRGVAFASETAPPRL